MMSELFKRDMYTDSDIQILYGVDIYEYDMHHAGISICKEYGLLSKEEIGRIEKNAKNKQDIARMIGLIQRSDKNFKKELSEGFTKARKSFFMSNELEDNDILSIKKDAIFTFKKCDQTEFGHIKFNSKHHYTSYLKINKLELYYSSDSNELDIKGIDDSDLEYHKDYMMKFMCKYFYTLEFGTISDVKRLIRSFTDQYKKLQLDVGYYREMNKGRIYQTWDRSLTYNDIGSDVLPDIDISYNYLKIITPMLVSIM